MYTGVAFKIAELYRRSRTLSVLRRRHRSPRDKRMMDVDDDIEQDVDVDGVSVSATM